MKNVLFALIAVSLSTNAFAFASPSQEARTKDYLESVKEMDNMAAACRYEQRFELLDVLMAKAYRYAGATSELQVKIVDAWYTSVPSTRKSRNFVTYFRNNSDNPQVLEQCASATAQLDDLITEL